MKKNQRGKRDTFTRYVDFFLFLQFIFDRILCPLQNKDGGIGLLPSVRSFVRPVVTHFRLSDTLFNFDWTGYLLVNFDYCNSFLILIPLISTDLTLLLWFQI